MHTGCGSLSLYICVSSSPLSIAKHRANPKWVRISQSSKWGFVILAYTHSEYIYITQCCHFDIYRFYRDSVTHQRLLQRFYPILMGNLLRKLTREMQTTKFLKKKKVCKGFLQYIAKFRWRASLLCWLVSRYKSLSLSAIESIFAEFSRRNFEFWENVRASFPNHQTNSIHQTFIDWYRNRSTVQRV